jgi:aspartyl/asparaginyl beta-hydroxylase (cupin superfamily)
MNEPRFWEEYLIHEPVCQQLCENWEKIRDEILDLKKNYPNWFTKYPKFKVEDPDTREKVRLYENDWSITALSKLSESYNVENNRAEKTGGSSLEKLVKRYRGKLLPTLNSIIGELDKDETLSNVFVSILSPGVIIKPHVGYSKDYMRIHLGLICDPECKITVGDETKTWEEGKILSFKDGGPYYHQVQHNGKSDRYVLSLDLKLSYLNQYINNSND